MDFTPKRVVSCRDSRDKPRWFIGQKVMVTAPEVDYQPTLFQSNLHQLSYQPNQSINQQSNNHQLNHHLINHQPNHHHLINHQTRLSFCEPDLKLKLAKLNHEDQLPPLPSSGLSKRANLAPTSSVKALYRNVRKLSLPTLTRFHSRSHRPAALASPTITNFSVPVSPSHRMDFESAIQFGFIDPAFPHREPVPTLKLTLTPECARF